MNRQAISQWIYRGVHASSLFFVLYFFLHWRPLAYCALLSWIGAMGLIIYRDRRERGPQVIVCGVLIALAAYLLLGLLLGKRL